MKVLLTVARNTFLESVRQPAYGMVVTVAALLIAMLPLTAHHLFVFTTGLGLERVSSRLIADLGLSTVQLAGLVLAVFITTNVVNREIEERTVATVLCKPVGRANFIIGKYLGVALAIIAAVAVVSIVTLLTVRVSYKTVTGGTGKHSHGGPMDWGVAMGLFLTFAGAVLYATYRNYFHGKPWIGCYNQALVLLFLVLFLFFGALDREYHFIWNPDHDGFIHDYGGKLTAYDWEVALGAFVSIQSVLILAAVAVAASTRLAVVGNAVVTGMVFFLGLLSGLMEETIASSSKLGALLLIFVPNLERYWLSDALIREQFIPTSYFFEISAYSGVTILAWLFVACFLFDSRDVG